MWRMIRRTIRGRSSFTARRFAFRSASRSERVVQLKSGCRLCDPSFGAKGHSSFYAAPIGVNFRLRLRLIDVVLPATRARKWPCF